MGADPGGKMSDMSPWVFWFSGAVLLSLAELLGGEFVLLMLGGGAVVATAVALVAPDLLWLQLLVFALDLRRIW